MPGCGHLHAAGLISYTSGLAIFQFADRLAGIAGLAPVPGDSEPTTRNLRGPKRYSRRPLRRYSLSAEAAARRHHKFRAYYDRKRHDAKNHKQAALALARRRINVIWALPRDGTTFHQE